jgi:hypothetical protein
VASRPPCPAALQWPIPALPPVGHRLAKPLYGDQTTLALLGFIGVPLPDSKLQLIQAHELPLQQALTLLGLMPVERSDKRSVCLGRPFVPKGPGDRGIRPTAVPQGERLGVTVRRSPTIGRMTRAPGCVTLPGPASASTILPRQGAPSSPEDPWNPVRIRRSLADLRRADGSRTLRLPCSGQRAPFPRHRG